MNTQEKQEIKSLMEQIREKSDGTLKIPDDLVFDLCELHGHEKIKVLFQGMLQTLEKEKTKG